MIKLIEPIQERKPTFKKVFSIDVLSDILSGPGAFPALVGIVSLKLLNLEICFWPLGPRYLLSQLASFVHFKKLELKKLEPKPEMETKLQETVLETHNCFFNLKGMPPLCPPAALFAIHKAARLQFFLKSPFEMNLPFALCPTVSFRF